MAVKLPENICLAPFAYITFDPAMNVSPCPALGGSTWKFKGKTLKEVWTSDTLNEFRQHMLNNGKHEVCNRCWYEESVGMPSQRTRLFDPNKDNAEELKILESNVTPITALDTNFYTKGPMQLAIKVGNICNLRCRSCNSADSVTLSIEGKYLEETYGLKDNFWLLETEPKEFTDQQIDDIVSVCENVRRIEFYGGEPLVDKQMPILLRKLSNLDLAKNIQLNISTNITKRMSEDLITTLGNFQHVNINLSIDGWGQHFHYLRHPADWDKVYKNIQWFDELRQSNRIKLTLLPAITVTSMNVYDLPNLIINLKAQLGVNPFLIIAGHPEYFSIKNITPTVANKIADHLTTFELEELQPIITALKNTDDSPAWESFKQVTQMIDKYRNESFSNTFPEYYNLLVTEDGEWTKI